MKKLDLTKNIKISTIAVGVIAGILISLLALTLETLLVIKGIVSCSVTVYLMALIIVISLFIANGIIRLVNAKVDVKHILLICVGYFVCILAVNMLIFGNGFNNIIYNLLGVGGGYATSLLHIRQSSRGISHRKKLRFR